ncbi:MAG: tRNA 2-selenouridine(34) synthase MnmH [Gammaproteobacteria bacterium]|nr:tRNA 2-selenouridine(34) synthase MnmH [Gammaproteobacteria bacterium]
MQSDSSNYEKIFLSNEIMMDVRAPVEFARGSFPNAVNLPLLNDEERTAVGTCYKQQGPKAALALGHHLVSGATKAERLHDWSVFTAKHPQGYLFCFRGGQRSLICQQWLADANIEYPRVLGGYKAMRRFLINTLNSTCHTRPFLVLGGQTGCGKTEVLEQSTCSVDLEGHAHHRGSAFGRRVGGQPTQINFENSLSVAVLQQSHLHPQRAILVEDESKLIGRRNLPPVLKHAMNGAPLVLLETDLEHRVEHTFHNYILRNLHDWQKSVGKEQGFISFAEELRESLHNIRRRLGGNRFAKLSQLLENAIKEHAKGNENLHRDWIAILLSDYYDPMYNYQLARKKERIIMQGNPDTVKQFISAYVPGKC